MRLPPIIVHSDKACDAQKAIENFLGASCVNTCKLDEQNSAYINFNNTDITAYTKEFVSKLGGPFIIHFNNATFSIDTIYYDI